MEKRKKQRQERKKKKKEDLAVLMGDLNSETNRYAVDFKILALL